MYVDVYIFRVVQNLRYSNFTDNDINNTPTAVKM